MANALIGFSGFVGSTLLKQASFESLYRSTNIYDIEGQSFDTVVCAGAPAQKWIANREPEADRQQIDGLIAHLKTIQCKTFILISTVDVFKDSMGADEETLVDERKKLRNRMRRWFTLRRNVLGSRVLYPGRQWK